MTVLKGLLKSLSSGCARISVKYNYILWYKVAKPYIIAYRIVLDHNIYAWKLNLRAYEFYTLIVMSLIQLINQRYVAESKNRKIL
jgi:hypothetical protein